MQEKSSKMMISVKFYNRHCVSHDAFYENEKNHTLMSDFCTASS